MSEPTPKIAFFGTPDIAVYVLEELEKAGLRPELIITNPDRPQGRKLILTPPPAKIWATEKGIPVFQPESLKERDALAPITATTWDLFVVVAYGLILPDWLIELPAHQTLNLHPSLLPKLRGPSPIRSAILEDLRETGVTVMLLDEKMDHGPIVAQEKIELDPGIWPMRGNELDELLAQRGGALLASVIPKWIAGELTPTDQDHTQATHCKKIKKTDGELAIDPSHLPHGEEAYRTLLAIRAYDGWPGTYFIHKGKRVKVTDAELDADGALQILLVIPEGKKEMLFDAYLQSAA